MLKKMELISIRERLAQLLQLGFDDLHSMSRTKDELLRNCDTNPLLIAVFDDGKEYISIADKPEELTANRGGTSFSLFADILQREGVDTSGMSSITYERHYLFDECSGESYGFELPSRKYLSKGHGHSAQL